MQQSEELDTHAKQRQGKRSENTVWGLTQADSHR